MSVRDDILQFNNGTPIGGYIVVDKECSEPCELLGTTVANPLGNGGSSSVYKAFQELTNEVTVPRAIKFFIYRDDITRRQKGGYPGRISREDFIREIANIAQASHENVIKVVGAGEHKIAGKEKPVPFIAMEYIDGTSLDKVLNNEITIDLLLREPTLALDMLICVAKGISYLHGIGLAHCDIAPKNIFLRNGHPEQAVVGDLGVARSMNNQRDKITIIGTKSYMPDDIRDYCDSEVDWAFFRSAQPRWDVFAFAKTSKEVVERLVQDERRHRWRKPLLDFLEECMLKTTSISMSDVLDKLQFLHPNARISPKVQELASSFATKRSTLMPIEAVITSSRLRLIVEHPALLRLAKVPQLAVAYQVAPGGSHSRYEHSLGALEAMRRYLSALLDHKEGLRYLSEATIETALLAALLSNLARVPFDNIFREAEKGSKSIALLFDRNSILDKLFCNIAGPKGTIYDIIKDNFPHTSPERVLRILRKEFSLFSREDHLVFSLLNSSLDVRVADFVRRDSLHLGITRGDAFQLDELLPHLTVKEHRLALSFRGVSVAEQIICQRYWLFNRIYWNRPNRQYVTMLRYAILECIDVTDFAATL